VILVDTSVWIDHLRKPDQRLQELLQNDEVAIHPLILMELALASIANRKEVISNLSLLAKVQVAELDELFTFIETRALYRKGIGVTDLHLIASALLEKALLIWTRDRRLGEIASSFGIRSDLA
jgi:predicted nucleic acid-binding protein